MRSNSSSKIKVSTEKLLKAVQARRETAIKEYEKERTAYEKAIVGLGERIAAALRKAADEAEAGRLPEFNYHALEVPFKRERPNEPHLELDRIDRLIKTLEMASDEAVTISADDAAEYLG